MFYYLARWLIAQKTEAAAAEDSKLLILVCVVTFLGAYLKITFQPLIKFP